MLRLCYENEITHGLRVLIKLGCVKPATFIFFGIYSILIGRLWQLKANTIETDSKNGLKLLKSIQEHIDGNLRPLLLSGSAKLTNNTAIGVWEKAELLIAGSLIVY